MLGKKKREKCINKHCLYLYSMGLMFTLMFLFPRWTFSTTLQPQLGHTDFVLSVTYSPDGKYLASGGWDKSIKIWEVASGKEIRTLSGHTDHVNSLSYSPNGKYLSSASSDKSIKIWEVASGKEIRTFSEDIRLMQSLSYNPNGEFLALARGDGLIKIWEVASGKEIHTLSGDKYNVLSIVYSPDGRYLASGGQNDGIKIWEVASGKEIHTFPGHHSSGYTQSVSALSYSPDGKYLVAGSSSGALEFWEIATMTKKFTLFGHRAYINDVTYSPNGKYLSSASSDKSIKIWEVASGKEIRTLSGHTDHVNSLSYSPNGKYLSSASSDKSIKIWEVASGKEIRTLSGQIYPVNVVSYSPDKKYIASGVANGDIKLWETTSGKLLRTFLGHSDPIDFISYSPDGKYLVSGGFDAAKTEEKYGVDDHGIKIWELATGTLLHSINRDELWVNDVFFDKDEIYVVSASENVDWRIVIRQIPSLKEIRTFSGHEYGVHSISYSPDGKYILSGGADSLTSNSIKIWEVSSGKLLRTLSGDKYDTFSARFSPDSKYLAVASVDKSIKIWRVPSGKLLRTLRGRTNGVGSISYSLDGKYLAVASVDKSIKIWRVPSGKLLRTLRGHTGKINSVSLSPDGKYLASGGDDGTLRLWRVKNGSSMVMASSVLGEWLLYTDDGLFDTSPGGSDLVAVVEGMRAYAVEQLALKNNRPDLILRKMGLGTPGIIEFYRLRYEKRLKKSGLKEKDLESTFRYLPKSQIKKIKKIESSKRATAQLSFWIEDGKSPLNRGLDSYQIYINGVPLYEKGKVLAKTPESFSKTVEIPLTEGKNLIEMSTFNIRGQESLRASQRVEGPSELEKDLYFIGFGVSDYLDEDIPDLKYAHKDALELAEQFQKIKGYQNYYIKTYTNQEVSKENIQASKKLLLQSKPEDTVVLFISGHGMHDSDKAATYYYLIHQSEVDLTQRTQSIKLQTKTAVNFEEIESLLVGLAAKQKLFLMDTCASGELDEVAQKIALRLTKKKGFFARTIKGFVEESPTQGTASYKKKKRAKTKSKGRSWLLEKDRYIHQDIFRRSGAVVFSSSRGNEFSYENDKLENGLFTEALLTAFREKSADKNQDNTLSLQELKAYVTQEVAKMSKDHQHPTVDRDNPYLRLTFP